MSQGEVGNQTFDMSMLLDRGHGYTARFQNVSCFDSNLNIMPNGKEDS